MKPELSCSHRRAYDAIVGVAGLEKTHLIGDRLLGRPGKDMMMRQLMVGGARLLGVLTVCAGLTGCCCFPPKPPAVAPLAETPWVLPDRPIATPAAEARRVEPLERPIPPTPVPLAAAEAKQLLPPQPVEIPPVVVAAIEDLGQKYPGLFVFDKAKGLFYFASDITFDSGSSVVKPRAKAALTRLAQILSGDGARDRPMTIVGHTDSDRVVKAATIAHLKSLGKSTDNRGLSEARAEAVAAVLRAGGVDARRMVIRARGQAEPITSNATAAGKARNRRVEIYLKPLGTSVAGVSAVADR